MTQLRVHRLRPDASLPRRAHPDDAGWDLSAVEPATLAPGERALVPTGLAIALPAGTGGLILPRSGLARDHGIGVVNAPGLIDAGYRGEIGVLLINHDPERPFTVEPGMRIAQLVVVETPPYDLIEVDDLPSSTRAQDGFGSTGIGA